MRTRSSPISSTIYYPALVTVQEELNTTATAVNASLSIFTFFTAFFPLMWASFGDIYGRRNIYLISFSIYVVGSIGCALSVNIGMLIAFRAFSAIGSSSVMSLGAGTISDIYHPHERGRAFSWYTIGPLLGPALGPIIGGYLNEGLGWRSTFWFLVIFSFLLLCGIFFLLPETFRPAPPPEKLPTTNEKEKTEVESAPTQKKRRVNPLQALDILRYKNIQLVVTFVAFTFMFFYLVNTTFTRTYTLQYGLSSGIVGLCYFPQAIGAMSGGLFGGRYSDKLYRSRVAKANGESWPEQRLGGWVMWTSIAVEGLAFIAYGWCIKMNVHFAWGLVCQFFLGFALMIPNVAITAYLVDCFRTRGASATACNNFVRYLMAGIGALIASAIDDALGDGVLYTICGGVLFLSSGLLVIVIAKGREWGKLREGQ
ncbi:hypothetical protein K450DRAFT_231796 [Umbelopsis ramanniana AG]|uniref:Major facilitator superfamily (MFS) profile domain-containing protein n=1 Tax=Umbelopsis ramanniana AG TaxID=1314678 RepID=A0AAD5EE62_UMBRA|nr:uncharacterized protein K450DRAFT_231796 [Umbelopsis ramanniana AG]KAI8581539.1 hypothetical protein K450DRAFT_231796 [Umbelopsis ramanniana AG]